MSATMTLYVRDEQLWRRARELGGPQGLSSLAERAIRQYLDRQETASGDAVRKFVLPITEGGDEAMHESIEFQGRLLIDSKGFSLEQLPRVRVYRTTAGRFVVYRTWPILFQLAPSYSVYSDLEGVEADPRALDTIWITEHDRRGEHTDLSSDIVKALRKAAGRRAVISIDQVDIRSAPGELVRLERDSESIRRRLQEHGQSDEDA